MQQQRPPLQPAQAHAQAQQHLLQRQQQPSPRVRPTSLSRPPQPLDNGAHLNSPPTTLAPAAPLPPLSPLQRLPPAPAHLLGAAHTVSIASARSRGATTASAALLGAYAHDSDSDSSEEDRAPRPRGPKSVDMRHSMDPAAVRLAQKRAEFKARLGALAEPSRAHSMVHGRASARRSGSGAVDASIEAFGFAEGGEVGGTPVKRSASLMQPLRKLGRFGFGQPDGGDPRFSACAPAPLPSSTRSPRAHFACAVLCLADAPLHAQR